MSHAVLLASALAAATLFPGLAAHASDRPDHFEGQASETVAEAMANLAEANRTLESILASDSLSPQQLHEVHELTYTLENALARLGEELERSAVALEEVHLASERNDAETVRTQSAVYLDAIRSLLGH
jgi:hypothetical protein